MDHIESSPSRQWTNHDFIFVLLMLAVLFSAVSNVLDIRSNHRQQHPVTRVLPPLYVNSTVLDSVPSWDGQTLYIVGNFTQVQGLERERVAAIDLTTGNAVLTFHVNVNGEVMGILEDHVNGYLRITGKFTTVNGVPRLHEAVLRESDGVLLG